MCIGWDKGKGPEPSRASDQGSYEPWIVVEGSLCFNFVLWVLLEPFCILDNQFIDEMRIYYYWWIFMVAVRVMIT